MLPQKKLSMAMYTVLVDTTIKNKHPIENAPRKLEGRFFLPTKSMSIKPIDVYKTELLDMEQRNVWHKKSPLIPIAIGMKGALKL